MIARLLLLAPHEQAGFGPPGREWIERRLVRAFIEKLGQRLLLWTAHVHGFAVNDLSDIRRGIVHVANQDRLCWADDDASRL